VCCSLLQTHLDLLLRPAMAASCSDDGDKIYVAMLIMSQEEDVDVELFTTRSAAEYWMVASIMRHVCELYNGFQNVDISKRYPKFDALCDHDEDGHLVYLCKGRIAPKPDVTLVQLSDAVSSMLDDKDDGRVSALWWDLKERYINEKDSGCDDDDDAEEESSGEEEEEGEQEQAAEVSQAAVEAGAKDGKEEAAEEQPKKQRKRTLEASQTP